MKTAHQYMIALTDAERTPSVKAMVDIILMDASKAIAEALQEGHEEGYDEGFDEGRASAA